MNIEENYDFISVFNYLLNFITDEYSNLLMKQISGVSPVEISLSIIKENQTPHSP